MSKNKVIFLDRDGIINEKRDDYVKSVKELEIFPDIVDSIKKFKELGYLVIVITNQSAINRGLTSHRHIKEIHEAIQNYLNKNQTSIDKFYYCPHRPDEACHCRKPKPGLLLHAIEDFNIDTRSSWVIGDSESDILAGKEVGCRTLKIEKNSNLMNALKKILKESVGF